MDSTLRMTTRNDTQPKLGKPVYSLTVYQNVRRATIFLDNKECPILMVSFDNIDNNAYREKTNRLRVNNTGSNTTISLLVLNCIQGYSRVA